MNYNKLLYLAISFFFLSLSLSAQVTDPPKWDIQLDQKDPAVGDTVTLILKANIPLNWYIYSNEFDPDLGPLLTEINLEEAKGISLMGGLEAINSKKKFDDTWEGDITYFEKEGEFRQKLLITEENAEIKGTVDYQMCSDVTNLCINYQEDFSITLGNPVTRQVPDSPVGEKINLEQPEESLIGFMLIAFLAGLAALLTPCVFPMIPMTVTFFTGRGKSKMEGYRNAFIYGFSIIAIYTIAGTVLAAVQGPEFANWLSTHWVPNVFFFAVFIFFALAFLGLFEITLPAGLVNKMDAKADKGGMMGIFFMAFTLVLVSFSCTGPIVGSILISSAGGALIKPILGMLAFSMAFALPFTLFAIFPGWLSSLPKSGGWLNSVKVVLGFLELALAFKFLSIADQVYHWGILDRDIYLAIWIVIFTMMGLYLLGKLRLPHDSPMESLGVPRLMLAIATFVLVIYMIPGMWGAPLKGLSGYLPPLSSHDFDLTKISRQTSDNELDESPKYADFLHFPHGIQGYFDYDQALRASKRQNKPLFIDFTGHGCVNCREMEARVWSDSRVLKRLKEDFVMVALYIDERHTLPESQWYTSTYDNKVKKTIGKQNADFQITRFNNNAQPYYVILDQEEELLINPIAYETDIQKFIDFLDTASKEFQNRANQK
ncbi:protein-disulfide reductase DsbD family protein [Cyclobacterium qasimii]|uniref:Cytochrome c-type biogenesis protein DsbD, protein-disulfide reductase n=2 Tax=Cyclobacterium qasimii TaxID=1350429 RepID=S7V839_9BACT|nr:thioredoxin family protein [Cyclobacterium qasimii]EPR66096.1 Cytochrome c-type biogenesis protein DsbD, protein-disulfide reductase [Cyclobacterium qasimii M12-11B]GEO21214.1 thiol:disulfide interchange protein DsbD [Cyclobacterium qasimii]